MTKKQGRDDKEKGQDDKEKGWDGSVSVIPGEDPGSSVDHRPLQWATVRTGSRLKAGMTKNKEVMTKKGRDGKERDGKENALDDKERVGSWNLQTSQGRNHINGDNPSSTMSQIP